MRHHFLLLSVVLVLGGCASSIAQRWEVDDSTIELPEVTRLDDHSVKITWPASFTTGPVDIFGGLSPDAIDRSRKLAHTDRSEITLSNVDSPYVSETYRLYYELIPEKGGVPLMTAERRLPLEGPDNFRDLGGYATADGRAVQWNRLYRSNDLSALTGRDLEYLGGVGIKLVCDFRSERERLRAPDREFTPRPPIEEGAEAAIPEWLNLTVEQTGLDPELIREKIQSGTLSPVETRLMMRNAYRSFVTDYSDQWAALFRKIASPANLPTVVHCTAGKDRTGFASALILLALGVPEKTVFEDYMLTNQYRKNYYGFVMRWVSLYSFFRTDPDDLIPLLEARTEYLKESLDAIRENFGSLDEYLATALKVTPSMREQIRQNMLTVPVAPANESDPPYSGSTSSTDVASTLHSCS